MPLLTSYRQKMCAPSKNSRWHRLKRSLVFTGGLELNGKFHIKFGFKPPTKKLFLFL